jgi:putative acetyltransferase
MKIEPAESGDHMTLIAIWEASVRATHHFLPEEESAALRPLILEHYFAAVALVCGKQDGVIVGFIGVAEGNIEMLFIAPAARGRGVGRQLVDHAIHCLGVTRVDVNEQNAQALGFYQHLGFGVTGRSPLDGQGKPYPLLHMVLTAQE